MHRLPLTDVLAAAFARAGTDGRPGTVILGFDDDGDLLLAVSSLPPTSPVSVTRACRHLLDLLAGENPPVVRAVVVAVQPGFGQEEAAGPWPELRLSFEASDCLLLGWLLVDAAGGVVSVEAGP